MGEFRYLRADEWGIRWARPPIDERLLDAETYVHHSAGPVPDDAVAAFRQLNEYAITSKGYSALDYDVLVHRNPTTGVVTIGGGREGYMSAATLDRNEQGEAVCLLGYFHPGHVLSRRPHPDELEGVARAIVWAMSFAWIDPKSVILGHRDNPAHPNATACPGDYLYAELPTIRARVAELLNPPPPAPEDTMVRIRIDGYADQLMLVPIANVEALRKMGLETAPLHVVTTGDPEGLARDLGYQFTPLHPHQ